MDVRGRRSGGGETQTPAPEGCTCWTGCRHVKVAGGLTAFLTALHAPEPGEDKTSERVRDAEQRAVTLRS